MGHPHRAVYRDCCSRHLCCCAAQSLGENRENQILRLLWSSVRESVGTELRALPEWWQEVAVARLSATKRERLTLLHRYGIPAQCIATLLGVALWQIDGWLSRNS